MVWEVTGAESELVIRISHITSAYSVTSKWNLMMSELGDKLQTDMYDDENQFVPQIFDSWTFGLMGSTDFVRVTLMEKRPVFDMGSHEIQHIVSQNYAVFKSLMDRSISFFKFVRERYEGMREYERLLIDDRKTTNISFLW